MNYMNVKAWTLTSLIPWPHLQVPSVEDCVYGYNQTLVDGCFQYNCCEASQNCTTSCPLRVKPSRDLCGEGVEGRHDANNCTYHTCCQDQGSVTQEISRVQTSTERTNESSPYTLSSNASPLESITSEVLGVCIRPPPCPKNNTMLEDCPLGQKKMIDVNNCVIYQCCTSKKQEYCIFDVEPSREGQSNTTIVEGVDSSTHNSTEVEQDSSPEKLSEHRDGKVSTPTASTQSFPNATNDSKPTTKP